MQTKEPSRTHSSLPMLRQARDRALYHNQPECAQIKKAAAHWRGKSTSTTVRAGGSQRE